jgi:hypothetical protein
MKIYHLPDAFSLYSKMGQYISSEKLATLPLKEVAMLYCLITYDSLRAIIVRGDSFKYSCSGITPTGEVLADAYLMVSILPQGYSLDGEKELENDETDSHQTSANRCLPTRRSSDIDERKRK